MASGHAVGGVDGVQSLVGCGVPRIVHEAGGRDQGRRPNEGVAAGVDRAGSLAHATGDAVAEQLVFRQLLWPLKVFEHVNLAFAGGREHAIGLQIRLELPDLVEHRVDVRDQIALDGESRQRCQFDDAEFVGLRACVVFARVSFGSGRVRAPLITRVAGAAESLVIGEGNRRRRFAQSPTVAVHRSVGVPLIATASEPHMPCPHE